MPTASSAPTPRLRSRPRADDAALSAGVICAIVLVPCFFFTGVAALVYYWRIVRQRGPRLPRMGERLTQLKAMRSQGGMSDEQYWSRYQLILNGEAFPTINGNPEFSIDE